MRRWVVVAGIVAALAGLLIGVGQKAPSAQLYSEPTATATITPTPNATGVFPVPGHVSAATQSIASSSYSEALEPLATGLAAGNFNTFQTQVAIPTMGAPLALVQEHLSTWFSRPGYGYLVQAFQTMVPASTPVPQGYYLPGAGREGDSPVTGSRVLVITTGWGAAPAVPTPRPATTQAAPNDPRLRSGPSNLTPVLVFDLVVLTSGHAHLRGLYLAEGYHRTVQILQDLGGMQPYYVIR